jgi:hypothetical protein
MCKPGVDVRGPCIRGCRCPCLPCRACRSQGADRLADTGVEDEAFGNETKSPAADASEHEITASFYADNQIATQT